MDEVEYVVPPGNTAPNVSNHMAKPPKKPNRAFAWLKSHIVVSVAGLAMGAIIVLVGVVMITGQKVSLFGLQLNPLYQQANCPEPTPEDPFPDCGPGGPPQPPIPVTDAPIVRFTIADGNDSSPNLPGACDTGEIFGPGSVVATNGAADCLKVSITNPLETYNKDFRICFSLDSSGSQCTPWASDGGGNSAQIMSGGSFSTAGVTVETRALPEGQKIGSVQVGVQVFYQQDNGPCGASSGMEWAKALQGQNVSDPWSYGDQQDDDPGCAQISLQSQVVTVTPPASISINGSFANGEIGVPYTQNFTITGTPSEPCTWSLVSIVPTISGAALANLSTAGTTGVFTATPTTAGTYQVSISLACQNGQAATATLPWVVEEVGYPIDISIAGTFANGYVGQAYSQQFTIEGGPTTCSWSIVSINPFMLSATFQNATGIGTSNGIFRATPTLPGTYEVVINATCGTAVAVATLPWVVLPQIEPPSELNITGTFANGTVAVPYTQEFNVTGAATTNCVWSIDSISPQVRGAAFVNLPGGIIDVNNIFSATPDAPGTYLVTMRVVCGSQQATATLPWVVSLGGPTTGLAIAGSFANGTVGVPYTQSFTATGATSTLCTWYVDSTSPQVRGAEFITLSASIIAQNNVFSATPDTPGTYLVSIRVVCGLQQATTTLPWVVSLASTPSLAIVGSFPNGTVGVPYTQEFNVTGASTVNCTWSIDSISPQIRGAAFVKLPGGIIDVNNIFSATPDAPGTYLVAMRVVCGSQIATATLPWVVSLGGPTPTGNLALAGLFPDGVVNRAYTTTVQTVNAGTSSCDLTLVRITPNVPGAVLTPVINIAEGTETYALFSATPITAGDYVVTVTAVCNPLIGDGPTREATKDFNWKVTATSTGGGGGGGGGSSASTCLTSANLSKLTAVYRYWSPSAGDHLYTTNKNEKPNGYRLEGISGYVFSTQVTGTVPIYRSSKPSIGSHYYSTVNDATNYGYINEGILGYAFATKVSGSAAWYRMHKGGDTSDYVHTMSLGEKTAILELGYVDEGTVANLCGSAEPTELQPVFRMFSSADGDHFYTTNFAERDSLLSRGYASEGIAGYIYGTSRAGSLPLYRSYSRALGDHLYTTNEAEARTPGYTYEGLMGYMAATDTADTVPFYRLFSSIIGDHFYTASIEEVASATRSGYRAEGQTGFIYLSQ